MLNKNKKAKLAKHTNAFNYNKKWIFGLGSQQFIFDYNEWKTLVRVSSILTLKLFSFNELIEEVQKKYPEISKNEIVEAIKFLDGNNFLMYSEEYRQNERYSRNAIFYRLAGANPQITLEKLRQKTVAVIGCGGIGNYMTHILGLSGIGRLLLVDDDVIELSNLNRQFLFTEEDIGQYKIDIIERELRKRNGKIIVSKYYRKIVNENSFDILLKEKPDLLILSADFPPEILYWTNAFCVQNKIPFVNVGYYNDISMVGPFVIPGESACIECALGQHNYDISDEINDELQQLYKYYKTASFPTINATASAMALNDIFKFLGEYGKIASLNKRIGIYSLEPKIEELNYQKDPNCQICGHL